MRSFRKIPPPEKTKDILQLQPEETSMTAHVDFATEDQILIANVSGAWEKPGDTIAAFSKILAQAESAGLYRVLYLSDMTGRIPTTLEGHFLGQRAAAILEPLAVGYVSLQKRDARMEEAIRFVVRVAKNRGLHSELFADPAEARYWLAQHSVVPAARR
ncbi:hypothetical protein LOC68_17140 [Blastopirellula sp. JC732]|uniref:Uncharacterized protein n=1 Tax=Blastopirellula sediminis TaxID=2894196 RepID=A0A9X1MP45_9BACT|nr:hypothetical protein [Blastopirellula sediminis]MCC9630121.1 hypothetical protein [Blastopirellula sediminis]